MKNKLIPIFFIVLIITKVLSAQQYKSNTIDSTGQAKKTLQELVATLKKQRTALYTVFDSSTFKKIMVSNRPIFKKFYSEHLKTYTRSREDWAIDSTFQSIFLYNNAQYLSHLPDSIIQLRNDELGINDEFKKHALLKYCKTSLLISLVIEEEELAVYNALFDEKDKIIAIGPMISFQKGKPTPKINKALTPFLEWREKAPTVYRLEVMRQ